MNLHTIHDCGLEEETRRFYVAALGALRGAGAPFLVGGAYAMSRYTGISRHTKDLDVFVRPSDARRILTCLAERGYRAELTFPHWLGKAYCNGDFIDVIFGSGNGIARVDDVWFERAPRGEIFGIPVRFAPPEEILWSKGFIQERERFDGADFAHLLRACAQELDWRHLVARYGEHWRVLLGHLVLFGFIYPAERDKIPRPVMDELLGRLRDELRAPPPETAICNGTILSRQQYLVDVSRWGYEDARIARGYMAPEQVAHWTAAIERDGWKSKGWPLACD